MLLTTKCNTCNCTINYRTWASDRVELAKTKGEFIDLVCGKCHAKDAYPVYSFSAIPSKLAQLVALIVFLIGTPLVLMFTWDALFAMRWSYAVLAIAGLLLVPVTIYGLILEDDRRKVNAFNRHKLKSEKYR